MTSKFNPYKQWLGLNTQYLRPHYFELFDLSPSLKDQEEITKIVDAAAKRCLKLLGEVPAGENDELVEEIQERVLRAQKVLSNPKTRLSYCDQLQSKTRERKASISTKPDPSLDPPSKKRPGKGAPKPAVESPVRDLNPPSPAEVVSPPSIPPTKVNSTMPPIAAKPVAVASQTGLPMAIPLAKPLPQEPVEPEESGSPMMGDLKISRVIRRRRSSKKFAVLVVVLMFAMLAGGAYSIFQNWSVIEDLGGLANAKDPTSAGTTAGDPEDDGFGVKPIVSPSDVSSDPDVDPRPLPRVDLNKLDELDEDAIRQSDREEKMANKKGDDDIKPEGMDSDVESKDENPDEKEAMPSDEKGPKASVLVKFDDLQRAQYERYLNRARHSLFRRDRVRAKRAIENAQQIKNSVSSEVGSEFVEDQLEVAGLVDEFVEIYDLCDGFWAQVISSSTEILGGQELEVSKQIISLVESDQDKVIVRNAGSNITYEYSFLPPQLAVVLAKQGSIKDIPTWNKQLAAFYAVNQVDGKDYRAQIERLLTESEAAGHSCDGIRHFSRFGFDSLGKVQRKVKFPNKKAQQEGISSFRMEQEYESVSDLSSGRALMAAQALEDRLTNDVAQDVIFLEEIRKLGIRSGDPGTVVDAISELGNLSLVNVSNLLCESYLEMADSELSVSQRRSLMEVAIPYLKSELGQKSKLKPREQLVGALMKLAQVYGMADSARRLDQVEL